MEEIKAHYPNNISLALLIKINNHSVFMPGDLMKEAMEYIINNDEKLKLKLQEVGIDFLIAPHHGLSTSFSEVLFQNIRDNKTKRLNIISEKVRSNDSDELRSNVDSRYYGNQYCACNNNLDRQGGIKTSGGHIVIDFSGSEPSVKIINTDNKQSLINEFV